MTKLMRFELDGMRVYDNARAYTLYDAPSENELDVKERGLYIGHLSWQGRGQWRIIDAAGGCRGTASLGRAVRILGKSS